MKEWRSILGELHIYLVKNELYNDILSMIDKKIILLGQGLNLDELFESLFPKMIYLFESEYIQIVMTYQKKLRIEASSQPNQKGIEVDFYDSACGYVIRDNTSHRSGFIDKDPIFRSRFKRINQPTGNEIKSFIAVPIKIMNTVVGVINIESPNKHHFNDFNLEMLEGIANQLAVAIRQANTIQSHDFLKKIRITATCDAGGRKREALSYIGEEIKKVFNIDFVQILIYNPNADPPNLRVVYNNGPMEIDNIVHVKDSISGYVIERQKSFYSEDNDISKDPRYVPMAKRQIKSELVIPMSIGAIIDDRDVLGVLNFEHEEVNAFDPYLRFRLERFAQQISPYFMGIKLHEELELTRSRNRARDMLLSVADLSSNLIHRLNNIAGSIKANVQEVQNEIEKISDEEVKKELKILLKDIEDAAKDALSMPRELRKRLTDKSPKDVVLTLKEVIKKFKEHPDNEEITFYETKVEKEDIPQIKCPSLYHVFENIVKNSINAMRDSERYSKELKTAIKVQEYERVKNKFVIIKISDNGVGIPKDQIDQIFEMTYTPPERERKVRGLGFGLSWTKTFVESIGGEIIIQSELGRGTDVYIKLPLNEKKE